MELLKSSFKNIYKLEDLQYLPSLKAFMIAVLKDLYGMSLKMRVILISLLQLLNSGGNKDDLKLFCFYQASVIAESGVPLLLLNCVFLGMSLKCLNSFLHPSWSQGSVNRIFFLCENRSQFEK